MRLSSLAPLATLLAALTCGAGCGPAAVQLAGEVRHPVTADGWTLTVEHFPSAAGTPKRPRPIILCHGILANRVYFKMGEAQSMVGQLTRAGFDVWLLDLRGRPDAGSPSFFFGDHTYSYTVDDYINKDMDTAIQHVLKATGGKEVIWLGHSLGGIIAYARIGTVGEPRIAQLVTLASPAYSAPVSRNLLWVMQRRGVLDAMPALPVGTLGSAQATLGIDLTPREVFETLWYPPNLTDDEAEKLKRYIANDTGGAELEQMAISQIAGEMLSADGRTSYSAGLPNVRVPSLLVAGRRDPLADPSAIRRVYEKLGSADKQLVIAGRAGGFSGDFGHTDIIVGQRAMREIVPRVVAWLAARNPAVQ